MTIYYIEDPSLHSFISPPNIPSTPPPFPEPILPSSPPFSHSSTSSLQSYTSASAVVSLRAVLRALISLLAIQDPQAHLLLHGVLAHFLHAPNPLANMAIDELLCLLLRRHYCCHHHHHHDNDDDFATTSRPQQQ